MGNPETAMTDDDGLTEFGAPRNFDGHLYPVYPFYVESLSKIPKDGWLAIFSSQILTWVVIPSHTSLKE